MLIAINIENADHTADHVHGNFDKSTSVELVYSFSIVRFVNKGLCTHFQLVLLTRPDGGHQRAGEKTFSDPRVDILARKDLVNFIDALDGE